RLGIPRSWLYRLLARRGLPTAARVDAAVIRAALEQHRCVERAAAALRVSATGLRRRLRQLDDPGADP
ncbi:MAG: helix-turn-helix domain-containing protein, partial [Acidobacteriota bacterium]